MPPCRRFAPQNRLLWQLPLTEVHQIFSHWNFFTYVVKATIRVEIHAFVVD